MTICTAPVMANQHMIRFSVLVRLGLRPAGRKVKRQAACCSMTLLHLTRACQDEGHHGKKDST